MEIGAWVPQAFYDLIGRILPGAFLLLLAAILFVDPQTVWQSISHGAKADAFPTTIVVLLGFVAAYVVGMVLGGIAFACLEWPKRLKRIGFGRPKFMIQGWRQEVSSIRAECPAEDPEGERTPLQTSFMYDFVQRHDAAAGSRLAKLRGELHMCSVLIIGGILGIAYVGLHGGKPNGPPVSAVIAGLVILVLGSVGLRTRLTVRARRLLENYWYLLRDHRTVRAGDAAQV